METPWWDFLFSFWILHADFFSENFIFSDSTISIKFLSLFLSRPKIIREYIINLRALD